MATPCLISEHCTNKDFCMRNLAIIAITAFALSGHAMAQSVAHNLRPLDTGIDDGDVSLMFERTFRNSEWQARFRDSRSTELFPLLILVRPNANASEMALAEALQDAVADKFLGTFIFDEERARRTMDTTLDGEAYWVASIRGTAQSVEFETNSPIYRDRTTGIECRQTVDVMNCRESSTRRERIGTGSATSVGNMYTITVRWGWHYTRGAESPTTREEKGQFVDEANTDTLQISPFEGSCGNLPEAFRELARRAYLTFPPTRTEEVHMWTSAALINCG